ncbi:glucose PTS transporter transcription antiterminator GlcT [Neobacillus dielmonensis]|uniref:glucose PTS transporter transcription antiterminator GlcT n=1 Tax=Neobacillus dielmonensis TaxID=1347369 RepID=UPI0005A9A100|nr:PRD domain-containing protein [Neobacillus dielmonensis]
MAELRIDKVLNNNVLIAEHPSYQEVVLIGKGIGFNRKRGDLINADAGEKLFVLRNEKEQANYIQLLPFINNQHHEAIISALELIKQRTNAQLDEHIIVALTDHLMFALSRVTQGIELRNPILAETKALYRFEYEIASEVVQLIKDRTGILLPVGEIGFIAIHIHSAMTNKNLSEVNQHSQLVTKLVELVEEQFGLEIDRDSVGYMRLVRHLRFAIGRVVKGERVEEPEKIAALLKEEYPVCYNLAWKLIKVMQHTLKMKVFDAEAVYLTMHLQRLQNKFK